MTDLIHTEGTIERAEYLAPFIGTAAEAAHTGAANMGVTLAKLRQSQPLAIYEVAADAETGEWIGDPKPTGEMTNALDWARMLDTDECHYDTYDHGDETRALIARWS